MKKKTSRRKNNCWGEHGFIWIKCKKCWINWMIYGLVFLIKIINYKKNNKKISMEPIEWIMICLFGVAPIVVAIITYFSEKEKIKAETERIKLQNKITKEINYEQLKAKSKHENIKDKIQLFQELIVLEEKLKSSGKLTTDEQKKLEALEMLKKEFKTSFTAPKEKPLSEPTKKLLVAKKINKFPKRKPKKK